MFNIGSGELVLIAVVALLVLGPKRLPELARGLGKFLREFRRQTDEVRGVVEREFYKMDQEMDLPPPVSPQLIGPLLTPALDAVPTVSAEDALAPMDHSDPRHPDYGKPDPSVEPEEPLISHHTDPTPAPAPEPAAAAAPAAAAPEPVPARAPVASDAEKKAS